jgi:hypothetical protein
MDTEHFSLALRVLAVCDNLLAAVLRADDKMRIMLASRQDLFLRCIPRAYHWQSRHEQEKLESFQWKGSAVGSEPDDADSRSAPRDVGSDVVVVYALQIVLESSRHEGVFRQALATAAAGRWSAHLYLITLCC